MTTYVMNEIAFDLGEPFQDDTIHELDAPLPGPERRVFSLQIDRQHVANGAFAESVRRRVREDVMRLFHHRVVERRELRLAGTTEDGAGYPAFAVVFEWGLPATRHHGRQLHVLVGAAHLCFSATAPIDGQVACDEYFDQLTETLSIDAARLRAEGPG